MLSREIIEESILGADKQFRNAVAVPIDDGRARGVAGQDAIAHGADVFETEFPLIADVLIKVDIFAIEQQIQFTIAVPIGEEVEETWFVWLFSNLVIRSAIPSSYETRSTSNLLNGELASLV